MGFYFHVDSFQRLCVVPVTIYTVGQFLLCAHFTEEETEACPLTLLIAADHDSSQRDQMTSPPCVHPAWEPLPTPAGLSGGQGSGWG